MTTHRCDTWTPFGRPVDPDVKMTYATASAHSGRNRSESVTGSPDSSATARAVAGSSIATTGIPAGASDAKSALTTAQTGRASSNIAATRSAG
nr:hypothetical protein GCM10017611_51100 [Rhodococcus wratislaviensis]